MENHITGRPLLRWRVFIIVTAPVTFPVVVGLCFCEQIAEFAKSFWRELKTEFGSIHRSWNGEAP